jgi:D-3-phosphoglycerate dehydrogenase
VAEPSLLSGAPPRVLVSEPLAERGLEALRATCEVDVRLELSSEQLAEIIGAYDGLVVRSATQVRGPVLEAAERLRVVGRAGIGVDNIDVAAATARGIVVVNAPTSNVVSAAEHAIALLLAQARNVPQANEALKAGRWERSRWGGVELAGKTLGVLGLGRVGQLVAARARGLDMEVLAFDPFVAPERYAELGVRRAETVEALFAEADVLTLHLPGGPETANFIDDDAIAAMKDGVRIVNAARGEIIDTEALARGLESGKVAGAGLDVFPTEPLTDSPLFAFPQVVVTPHLGASTREAQDRAGTQVAEQVVAALTGGAVTSAVNIPSVRPEDQEALGPYLPLARALGRLAWALSPSHAQVEAIEVAVEGALAGHDTRLLTLAALEGALRGAEEGVNLVNARSIADSRGLTVIERRRERSVDYTNLVRVRVDGRGAAPAEVAGTAFGRAATGRLTDALGLPVDIELSAHMVFLLYPDRPGVIGRVGTLLGQAGVNIASIHVSRESRDGRTLMAAAVDSPIGDRALAQLRAMAGIDDVRFVTL